MRASVVALGRNAIEILSKLPEHGVGAKIARSNWPEGSFWTVSRVRVDMDGKHGKANGTLVWKGEEARRTRVRGLHKPDWRLVSPAAAAAGAATPALAALKAAEAAKAPEAPEATEAPEAQQ